MANCTQIGKRGLNIELNQLTKRADGGYTGPIESWQMAALYAILQELKKLNTLLACPNFIGIPRTLRGIQRNTAKRKRKAKK